MAMAMAEKPNTRVDCSNLARAIMKGVVANLKVRHQSCVQETNGALANRESI
jgi:hypothetical protein